MTINSETGWLTVANQTMLDREATDILELEVCTRQTTPLAYLSKDVVAKGRSFEIDGKLSEDILRTEPLKIHTTNNLSSESSANPLKPVPVQSTNPPTINVQPISPAIRSLSPRALLEKNYILNEQGAIGENANIERSFLSRKKNSFGRLLATRRILSQAKAAQNATPELYENGTETNESVHHRSPDRITREVNPLQREDDNSFFPTDFIRFNNTLESPCSLIRLTLLDANDNNPVFVPSNHYQFAIMDTIQMGEVVGVVSIKKL